METKFVHLTTFSSDIKAFCAQDKFHDYYRNDMFLLEGVYNPETDLTQWYLINIEKSTKTYLGTNEGMFDTKFKKNPLFKNIAA